MTDRVGDAILGIDLGTTYSVVATCDDDGTPRIVRNALDAETTPSVVHFDGPGTAEIGQAAAEAAPIDPDNTVALIKRQMGQEVPLQFHGADHTPESVSGVLLRGLVAQATGSIGPVRAVVTVPAYFGTREREATALAARLAGIDLLELLAEPVAAGLHYGVERTTRTTVLVFDLGGGTFDATVLTTGPTGVEVLATDGDHSLGGADIDRRLADVLLDRLAEQSGPGDDPRDDESVVAEARLLAEAAKRALSRATSTTMRLRTIRTAVTVTVDRAMLERLTVDLLDRTIEIVDRLLATAGTAPDEVILVGGATRMPAVGARLEAHLGRRPRLVDPDLAVALGAARRARILATDRGPATAVAVLPRALGMVVRDSHDPDGLREFVEPVLAANTSLPATATTIFATILRDQRTARIRIVEQAGTILSPEMADHRPVLDAQVSGLDGLAAGSRVHLEVTVSRDGRIDIRVRADGRTDPLELQAYVDGVADSAAADVLAETTTGLTIRS